MTPTTLAVASWVSPTLGAVAICVGLAIAAYTFRHRIGAYLTSIFDSESRVLRHAELRLLEVRRAESWEISTQCTATKTFAPDACFALVDIEVAPAYPDSQRRGWDPWRLRLVPVTEPQPLVTELVRLPIAGEIITIWQIDGDQYVDWVKRGHEKAATRCT